MSDNPPSHVLQDLLIDAGILSAVSGADWSCTLGMMAKSPDKFVSLYDYGGANPDVKWNIDRPSVQIRVRTSANGYSAGYAKAKAIKDTLLGIMSQDIDGDRWISISMVGDINFLRRDENSRPEWTLNFSILKETALNLGAARQPL